MKISRKILLLFLALCGNAHAQNIQQYGQVTPGHLAQWYANQILGDAGTAQSNQVSSLGATGPGSIICANSNPITTSYYSLCLDASDGQIIYKANGGATPKSLVFLVNGVSGIALSNLPQAGAATLLGNTGTSTAAPAYFTIQGLSSVIPVANNDLLLMYQASSGALKAVTVSNVATSQTAGVSSIGGQAGAFTVGAELTVSGAPALDITTNGVTNSLLAQMAAHTVKCNSTGSTANASDCTSATFTGLTLLGAETIATTLGVTGATTLSSTLGVTGAATFSSTVAQNGASSGAITEQTQAAAGTWNWNWPVSAGSAGQLLTSQGGGSTAMSWTGNGQIQGTSTNDSASSGNIGEYISSSVGSGGAISLSNNTPADITHVSLTAGDWDCRGNVAFTANTNNQITSMFGWIHSVSATQPNAPNGGAFSALQYATAVLSMSVQVMPVAPIRVSLASTANEYLTVQASVGSGSITGYGFIGCRRMR